MHPPSATTDRHYLLLWLTALLYIAFVIGLRLMGFADFTDSEGLLFHAVPDLLRGDFDIYSRTFGGAAKAPGVGMRIAYPPGPILIHVPIALFGRVFGTAPDTLLAWAALPGALGEVLCAGALWRVWRRNGNIATGVWPWLAVLAFIRAGVVWRDAQVQGHWEGLMAFCVLRAYLAIDARPGRAGVWAGCALLLKTTCVLVIGPLGLAFLFAAVRTRRWGGCLAFGCAAAATLLIPLGPYLLHDAAGVKVGLLDFPAALAVGPGSVWWMGLRALGYSTQSTAFLWVRPHANTVLLLTVGILSVIVLWRRPQRRIATRDVLGLMTCGGLALIALGKAPNPWYAVMGTALLLAWCGSTGKPRAWAAGIGAVLVQDTAIAMLPAEVAVGALTLWGMAAIVVVAGLLLGPLPSVSPHPPAAPS